MHPYIPHLISDIAAAHREAEEVAAKKLLSFGEEMEEVERYLSEEPSHTLGYYCGLKREQFPPASQLGEEDMQLVCEAFHELLSTWNLSVDFPENIPVSFAYKLLIELLDKKTMIATDGFVHFDFCTGYAPDCELKEYCPCLEYWNKS